MSRDDQVDLLPGPGEQRSSLVRRAAGGAAQALIAAVFIAAAFGGVALLHLRAAAEAPHAAAPPVSVATTRVEIVDGYLRASRFTGRLEPARRTDLAFERAGLVLEVLPEEGESVPAGALVARLDASRLEVARRRLEARRRELEAERKLAELNLERQARLKTQGWSPEQRLDETQAAAARLSAAIDQVAAELAGVDIDIKKTRLTAPFDGRVAARSIDEGAVAAPGTPVLTLLEAGRRQARIGLPPEVARDLDPNAAYRLEADGAAIRARLVAVRPDIDPATRTATALFEAEETASELSLGDLVTLALERRIEARGAWLPIAALKEGRKGLWTVLVAEAREGETVVRPEAVEVLHAEADRVFVRGTLGDGDAVLTGGVDRVVAGQRVALAGE